MESLAFRFVGIRQQEHDLLTLLRRANFKSIEIVAIEAFVPDEEDPEKDVGEYEHREFKTTGNIPAYDKDCVRIAENWDLPAPSYQATAPPHLEYRPVLETSLANLRSAESDKVLAQCAVTAVERLLNDPKNIDDPTYAFIEETADYLVSEVKLEALISLLRIIGEKLPDARRREKMIQRLGGNEVLDRFISRLEPTDKHINMFIELINLAPDKPLEHVLDRLMVEKNEVVLRFIKGVLVQMASAHPDQLLDRLQRAPARVASELFAILAFNAPERCVDAALRLALHEAPAIQMSALGVLCNAPPSKGLEARLRALMEGKILCVRVQAAKVFRNKYPRTSPATIFAWVNRRCEHAIEVEEALALGRLLAETSSKRAFKAAREWIKPRWNWKTLIDKLQGKTTKSMHKWAAAAALEAIGDKESLRILDRLAKSGNGEIENYCRKAFTRLRGEANNEA